MANLKQGTLSFSSTKRNNSTPIGKKSLVAEKGKNKQVDTVVKTRGPSEAIEICSDQDSAAAAKASVPVKRTREGTKARSSAVPKQAQVSPSEKAQPFRVEVESDHLDVEDKAGRYRNYYNEVRSKMGYIQPVHSEGQNKIHLMLRFFDMSYEFGPFIGMTRLERWKRAEALGLNPPVEVRDILLTKEGSEKVEYTQCVLQDEV